MKIYLKIKTLQSSFSFFQKLILSSFNLMAFITKDDRRQSSRANEGLPSSLDSQGSNTSDDRRILSFQTDSKNSSYPLKSPPMLISRVLERTITPWTTSPPHWTTPSNPRKVPRGYNTHRIRCSQKTEETRFFSSGMMPIAVETGTTEKRLESRTPRRIVSNQRTMLILLSKNCRNPRHPVHHFCSTSEQIL